MHLFSCNACGKCCTSGPSMTFREAIKFSDKFIISLFVRAEPISELSLEEQEQEALIKLIITAKANDNGFYRKKEKFAVTAFFGDSGYSFKNSNLSCCMLSNEGLCTIHLDKPDMCKTLPFDCNLPQYAQGRKLDSMKEYGCVQDVNDTETPNPDWDIIYRSNEIVHRDFKNAYDVMRSKFAETNIKIGQFLDICWSKQSEFSRAIPSVEDLTSIAHTGGKFEIFPPMALSFLKVLGDITDKEVETFRTNQSIVIENELKKALQRKDKNDRARTAHFRKWLDLYKNRPNPN